MTNHITTATAGKMPDGPKLQKSLAEQIAERAPITAQFLRLLHPPGDVFEIRGLGIGDYDQTYAGFFDDPVAAADAAIRLDLTQNPRGIYLTVNPVRVEMLSRIHNRIGKVKRGETSSDKNVTRRRWLFVDIDPERAGGVSGIPATDDERAAAIQRAKDVCGWLMSEHGWSEPLSVDSGNGCYLLFPIDLPNDNDSTQLVKAVLAGIGAKWSDDAVKIDTSVCNAARICRVFGTVNRKGDHTEARPWRFCQNLYAPDYLEKGWAEPMPEEKLQAVAALAPPEKSKGKRTKKRTPATTTNGGANTDKPDTDGGEFSRLMVEQWLADRGVDFRSPHTLADGRKCWPISCPFNPDHGHDACITQEPDGKLGASCFHNGCDGHGWQEFKTRIGKPKGDHYDPPLGTRLFVGNDEHQTELANSQRFVAQFEDEVLFVPAQGKFRIYDDKRWAEDPSDVGVMQRAKEIARNLWREVENCMTEDCIDFAQKSAKHSGLRAMAKLAGFDLAVDHNRLDSDPFAFNVQNGTIDLRTGTLRPHNPRDLLTKISPVAFDPAATCPRFDEFLRQVFVSKDLIAFMQRLVGYCITGNVSQHVLPICWGVGSNGKSTLLVALQYMMGDYADQAPSALLAMKKSEQHPTELAGLLGKRFVVASETENSCRLAEGLVKQLTGGDAISARRMREDFWTFSPTHKIVLCTNHKPRVRGTDHGIWRRLLLIPFTEVFEGHRKDKDLPQKLQAEAPGILAWAVRGCLEWQRLGLNPPVEVEAATQQYRSGEDVIGRFVTECCIIGSTNFTCRFAELYDRLKRWCDDGGEPLPSAKATGNWLQNNGFERFHSGVVNYRGIGLIVEAVGAIGAMEGFS